METEAYIIDPFLLSAPGTPLALVGWYAEPMDARTAQALLEQAQQCLKDAYAHNGDAFRCQLQQLIARFRLGHDVRPEVDNLLATACDDHHKAIVQLVYGQLLVSVTHRDALPYLDAGFALAANRLSADEYFVAMKRHQWLHALPYTTEPAASQDLKTLLSSAAVILRLRGQTGARPSTTEGAHLDTLD